MKIEIEQLEIPIRTWATPLCGLIVLAVVVAAVVVIVARLARKR
jgi:hypothetical protein